MGPGAQSSGTSLQEGALEQNIERALRGFLATQLAAESGAAELIHVVLAAMATLLVWRWVPHKEALLWFNAVAIAAFGRSVLRRTANTLDASSDRIVGAIRRGVAGVGLAWGAGVLLVGPQLPLDALAWITVLFAGLVAGGTTTLLPDPRSYYILLATLLIPLGVAIGINGNSASHVEGIALVVMFGIGMAGFYRRAHAMLLKQFRAAKRLELIERAAGEARKAAERLSSIIEATTDHVAMAGPDGQLRYVNRAGRAMVGIGADEDVTVMNILDLSPPRLRDHIQRDNFPKALRDGVWAGESTFLHRDGRELPVSLVALVHRAPDGTVEAMSAVARDVSEQVVAREALRVALDVAEQATAAKSAFLANTSHEIRTPLNGILGMVELLLDTRLTPEQRRSAELIASSGETLLNTINDVLDLSKIEAEQLELEEIPFDLHQLLHSSVRLFATKASALGLELVSDVNSDVPQHVIGDSHRLRQILSNLIGNAIKFTSTGEVALTVRAHRENGQGARVHFSVRDTGIGIAAENAARIFQPFSQVDASITRHYGGTGLGLSISHRLVDLMGGRLEVTSEVGKGSDFHFGLVLGLTTQRVSASVPAQLPVGLDGVRVLVVDDHPANRRVTVDMMRWAQCDVDEADSATSAFALLRAAADAGRPYRLVLSDVQMPGRDGFDLALDIRACSDLQQASIMLLTSATRRGDNDRCRELGVAAYLQKPVSRVELLEAAAAALSDPGAAQRPSLVTRHTIEEARRSVRILLVEDNPVNQEVAAAMLRRRGHDVVIVDDGRAAVEAVRSLGNFDLILMDLQMPVLDGLQATRQIRSEHPTSPAIVALTANVSAEERQRCFDAGMNGYLTKPFKSHELFAAVEGWGTGTDAAEACANKPKGSTEEKPPADLAAFRGTLADAGIESVGDEMLGLFLTDGLRRMSTLSAWACTGDAHAIAQAAHAFKSGAANVRAELLTALLQSAETSGGEGNVADAQALMPRIQTEFDRVSAYLRAQLDAAN